MMKKIFKIQSFSDIITNSSSELFVFRNEDSIEDIKEWLSDLIPNWQDEYFSPIDIENVDEEDIEMFVMHHHNFVNAEEHHIAKKYSRNVEWPHLPKITFEEFQEKKNEISYFADLAKTLNRTTDELYSNWERYNPFIYNSVESDNFQELTEKYDYQIKFTKLFYDIMKKIDAGVYLMFSKDENPSYEGINLLETMANITYYHLG